MALWALCLAALDAEADALAALTIALRLAEPEGYLRPFVDAGAPMAKLLAALGPSLGPDPIADYARQVLDALQVDDKPEPLSRSPAPQAQSLIEPLTAREIDVLGLLAEGLTNAEIGQRLVISLPTVKSHTRNLYGKLGVHSRREAVARARELGLLEDGSG
jgi:LuxR family maltose regulon positive regulatory protein